MYELDQIDSLTEKKVYSPSSGSLEVLFLTVFVHGIEYFWTWGHGNFPITTAHKPQLLFIQMNINTTKDQELSTISRIFRQYLYGAVRSSHEKDTTWLCLGICCPDVTWCCWLSCHLLSSINEAISQNTDTSTISNSRPVIFYYPIRKWLNVIALNGIDRNRSKHVST